MAKQELSYPRAGVPGDVIAVGVPEKVRMNAGRNASPLTDPSDQAIQGLG